MNQYKNRLVLWLSIFAMWIGAAAWAVPAAQDARETIVFIGDSITASGQYVNYVEGYLATRFPERSFRVVNSGKSSENLSGLCEADHPNNRRPCLFERFDAAVTAFHPQRVVACYGINDGIYHPFSADRFAKYQDGVRRLIGLTRQTGADLLLLTPPVYDSRNPGQPDVRPEETYGYKRPFADYDQVMDKYAAWLTGLKEEKVAVADLHTRMKDYLAAVRQGDPGFIMSRDGIHPGADGHLVMAMEVLKGWGMPARVDRVVINAGTTQGNRVMEGEASEPSGGIISFRATDLGFTWKSKIPMPADAQWSSRTLQVLGLSRELNDYRLVVKGFIWKEAVLRADGKVMGKYSSEQLAEGIDLTTLPEFPTVVRSRQILALIEARRKLENAAAKKGASPGPECAELDRRIHELSQPMKVEIGVDQAQAGQ